ncbi:MAG: hypothetical protein O7H39_04170, partial [Gammaproteobacteria bacterium]|nr:hypothetical protein [Gammaproteobacteria bacterium]
FSWLVLIAATSLGAQVLLTEIFAQTWANVFITAAAVAYCAIVWWKPYEPLAARTMLRKIVVATLFFRFFVVLVTLASSWAGNHFLSERQDLAIDAVATTTENIEAPRSGDDETWFDQIRQAVDIQAQLASLEQRVDVAISYLVDLIVTFVVQTIVFPLGAAAFAVGSIRAVWRRL